MLEGSVQIPEDPKLWLTPDGEVWRKVNCTHPERRQWVQRKFDIDKDGYYRCRVAGKNWMVSRLVYRAFNGPLLEGLVVCHADGNNTNNTPSNLIQATQKANISHKKLHGTHQSPEKHPRSIHTEKQVKAVRTSLKNSKRTQTGRLGKAEASRIAKECEVSVHLVRDISSKGDRLWQ